MMVFRTNLGTKRPGVNTSPKAVCEQCNEKRFKRDFRLKSGRVVKICKDCRKAPVVPTRSDFERHLSAISKLLKADYMERKTNGKEVKNMGKVTSQSRDYANSLTTLPDKIAAIISRTYLVRGDDPKTMPDDEAITRIRNLLEEIDEHIINRNKNKRLS